MSFAFKPAASFTDRHGVIVAFVGPPNSGKTYSGCRLAKGIAEAQGKRFAVLDTEGGRTLHLRKEFDFDFTLLEPPHRPERYLEAAHAAQDAGYGALLVDSFSMEWRGPGGVLDWMDEELEAYLARQRAFAEQDGRRFDESRARNAGKSAASIRPKQSHKLMLFGLLGIRMPLILSVRGEMTYDPEKRVEVFKPQCHKGLLFEVTVSFRLAADKKGVIDLSDATSWKMEGAHRAIFRDGEVLSERHGELINAWATNAPLPDRATAAADELIKKANAATTEEALLNAHTGETERRQLEWLKANRPELFAKVNEAVAARQADLLAGGSL